MDLGHLHPAPGSTRNRKRVGRGPGSGSGKTASRGHKGKGSRSGGNTPPGYEGGQMPLRRRLPKRGFRPVSRVEVSIVNLKQLALFPAGSTVGPEELVQKGLARAGRPVKILGEGIITHALTVRVNAISASAREHITGAGGTVELIGA